MFTIDAAGKVRYHDDDTKPPKGEEVFSSERTFKEAYEDCAATMPLGKFLVVAYNGLPGVKPVKSFESTEIGLKRLLSATGACGKAPAAARKPKAATVAASAPAPATKPAKAEKPSKTARAQAADAIANPRTGTLKAEVLEMLKAPGGTTREAIQNRTGWQAHTVRGFISILGRTHVISRVKTENGVVYSAA